MTPDVLHTIAAILLVLVVVGAELKIHRDAVKRGDRTPLVMRKK